MARLTDRSKLPDAAKPVADLIEKFGFKWEFDYEHPIPDWQGQRVQIRDDEHYAPTNMVTRYKEAMQRGDKFAPIVVSLDEYLVDGATRSAGAQRAKLPNLQAFILTDAYRTGSASVRRRMHLLGAALNARNGKGIDKAEIRRAVEVIGEDGTYDATRIAALLGVTERMVTSMLQERKGRDRADRQGIVFNGLASTQVRMLGTARLNDAPWYEMARLAVDAGLGVDDLRSILTSVREAGSDAAGMKILAEEREARKEQIADNTARGRGKPPAAGKLRQYLGFILRFASSPEDLVEYSPTLGQKHYEAVEQAVTILSEALDAQGRRNQALANVAAGRP